MCWCIAAGLVVPESGSNVISQEDIENHNKEGGCWIIIDGMVYDVKQFAKGVREWWWESLGIDRGNEIEMGVG